MIESGTEGEWKRGRSGPVADGPKALKQASPGPRRRRGQEEDGSRASQRPGFRESRKALKGRRNCPAPSENATAALASERCPPIASFLNFESAFPSALGKKSPAGQTNPRAGWSNLHEGWAGTEPYQANLPTFRPGTEPFQINLRPFRRGTEAPQPLPQPCPSRTTPRNGSSPTV